MKVNLVVFLLLLSFKETILASEPPLVLESGWQLQDEARIKKDGEDISQVGYSPEERGESSV